MGVVWDRYRVCLYCGDKEGERGGLGTEIRNFILWEGGSVWGVRGHPLGMLILGGGLGTYRG